MNVRDIISVACLQFSFLVSINFRDSSLLVRVGVAPSFQLLYNIPVHDHPLFYRSISPWMEMQVISNPALLDTRSFFSYFFYKNEVLQMTSNFLCAGHLQCRPHLPHLRKFASSRKDRTWRLVRTGKGFYLVVE